MKTKFTVAAVVLALTAMSAWAGTVKIEIGSPHQSGFGGGEFKITVLTTIEAPSGFDDILPGSWFDTFCVETDEYFHPGNTYYAVWSNAAMGGGSNVSGDTGTDPLDDRTAYLYTRFVEGSLRAASGESGTHYGSPDDAEALQRAFWFLEEENGGANNYYAQLATSAVGAGWSNPGNVRILQLWDTWSPAAGYSGNHQDQLVYFDEGTPPQEEVPLPASAWLGLGLLAALGVGRRLRRRRENTALS